MTLRLGRCISLKAQEYKALYSENIEELKSILEAIIARNSQFSKMEIVDMLKAAIDESLGMFLNDLKIVNYKGEADELPTDDICIGDSWNVNGGIYICEQNDPEIKWRRMCTENDLSAYYTKLELDEKYIQHVDIVSGLVSRRSL